MRKRVLLLDTSFAAGPIYAWLEQIGCEVWTIGNRPKDLLACQAPERYIQANYADPTAVQAHVDRLNLDYVVPGCTDISIETAQQLRVPLTRLDPPEIYQQLAGKAAFRALCKALDLPAPTAIPIEAFPRIGQYIAKPADAFSGHGVSTFDRLHEDAAIQAITLARAKSRSGEALIETYAQGQLYSYSCFLESQVVTDGVIVREGGSVTPYAVDTSYLVDDFSYSGLEILNQALDRLATHLSLVDGLLHAQFIWDGETPSLIELSRRCPGDLYPRLVQLSTGSPHAARYAPYFVGETVPRSQMMRRHILRHTVTAEHKLYEGLWFNHPASIVELHPLAPIVRKPPVAEQIDRVAVLFVETLSKDALEEQYRYFLSRRAYQSRTERLSSTTENLIRTKRQSLQ
jgi:hypothetical protein